MHQFAPIDAFASYEDFRDNFRVDVPGRFNFAFDVVDALAAEDPGRLAMLWCDDRKREFRFSMGDIAAASSRAARFFQRHGVRKGDAVMLMLRRHHAYWTAVIGLHKLGAIAIPATSLLTAEDITYRIRAINVKMIVAVGEPSVIAAVEAATKDSGVAAIAVVDPPDGVAAPPWIDFEAACAAEEPSFPRPEGDGLACDHDPMLVYFTSGTSSYPKMVVHGHLYPLGHIVTARHWLRCRPGGLHFTLAETGWGKASWGKLYGQWLSGCAVLTYDFARFSARRILEVAAHYRATSFCAPPTVYRHMVREPMERYDLSALEAAASAGEALNPEVFERFKEATGLEIHEGYGQTEATLITGVFPGMEVRPGSIGKPSPGYDLDILDSDGRPCAAGEPGQLVVRTVRSTPIGLFEGYYNDPAMTAEAWRDGIYYTGDMVKRDEDGYLWFIGRADDVIKSSGYRIGPFEVEHALQEHPAVQECAVTGVPDPQRGFIVKATVVLNDGYAACDKLRRELQAHVKRITAAYKVPRLIEFVASLPKTISGKIRRFEVRLKDSIPPLPKLPKITGILGGGKSRDNGGKPDAEK